MDWRKDNEAWWMDHRGNMIPIPANTTHGQWLEAHAEQMEPVMPGLKAALKDDIDEAPHDEERYRAVEHAFKRGWHRVLHGPGTVYVHNGEHEPMNAAQVRAVKDHAMEHKMEEAKYLGGDTVERPIRLAAIPPAGQQGGSVLLRVPTPTPTTAPPKASNTPAPAQPIKPTAPVAQPTFILPQ